MPDIYNPNQQNQDDEENQMPGTSAPMSTQSSTITPGAATAMGSGAGGQRQTGSGRFANLQKYIQANQGTNLGQQTAAKIGQQAQQAQTQIGQQGQQLESQIGGERQRLGQGAESLFQSIRDNPVEAAGQGLQEFSRLRTGQANAPQADLNQAQQQAQNVQQLAQQAGSEAGRFQLLKQFYGTPTYTTGQQRLDQLLLQASPDQARSLQSGAQQAQQQTMNALQQLQQQQTAGQQEIATLAQQRAQQAQELIGSEQDKTGLLGGLVGDIQGRTEQQQKQAELIKTALTNALSNKGFESDQQYNDALAALTSAGINPQSFKVYDLARNANFRPEQFVSNVNITPEAVASEQDRARLQSLYKLAGIESPTFLQGPAQPKADLSKVLNTQALQEASQKRKAEYETTAKPFGNRQEFMQAILSGKYSPQETVNTLVKYGLSPQIASQIMQSEEFAGKPGGPGMHAATRNLAGTLGVGEYGSAVDQALKNALAGTQQQFGVNNTLKDLIQRYGSIPMSGTSQFQPTPIATGVGGKIGLF